MPTELFGTHTVQVWSINPDSGQGTPFGPPLKFTNNPPTGVIQSASATSITGYAYDPDQASVSIDLFLYVDGTAAQHYTDGRLIQGAANINDSSLTSIIGSPNHGFDVPISGLSKGSHTLALYGKDPVTGLTALIGSVTTVTA